MATIVITYKTATVDGITVRIYDDATEKYFDDPEDASTRSYIEYLSNKGYSVDVSPIKVYTAGELDVEEIVKEDALSKLTEQEKEALGIN